MNPYTRETIDHWVSDFCGSTRAGEVPAPAREWAADILTAFLVRACESRDVAPADVEERDVRAGLLEGAAPLGLPASVHEVTPALCALFLAEMQDQGRLSGGRALGLFAKALLDPYLEASGTRSKPFVAPASRIGRNDPCPCGSGKKYKKCCQGLLGNQPG